MKFELFLNQLSASQAYLGKENEVDKLNCIGKCNPYNSSHINGEAVDTSNIENLYKVLKKWKFREESFGHIVFDTNNGRLYLTDEAGYSFISNCMKADNFSDFKEYINKQDNNKNINKIQSICI